MRRAVRSKRVRQIRLRRRPPVSCAEHAGLTYADVAGAGVRVRRHGPITESARRGRKHGDRWRLRHGGPRRLDVRIVTFRRGEELGLGIRDDRGVIDVAAAATELGLDVPVTPEGVVSGRPEKVWLAPGDEVVVEIGPLGRLANRMVEDRP